MITIITEKILVARKISRVVGALQRKVGYYGGNDYCVTWIDDYMPHEQRNIIKNLLKHSDEVIVATEPDETGERRFRSLIWLMNYRGDATFKRLWLNSLTIKSIRNGLEHLYEEKEFDFLCKEYYSEQKKRETREYEETLSAICKRYWKNKTFESEAYWMMHLSIKEDDKVYNAVTTELSTYHLELEDVYGNLQNYKKALIFEDTLDFVTEEAPQLFDLTALQQEANRLYGYSAKQTLEIAQKLYEAGVITYPRTTCQHIPQQVYDEFPKLLRTLIDNPKWGALSMTIRKPNPRVVRDLQPFEHHAIIITGEKMVHPSNDDKRIYDLIVRRILEALSENCVKKEISVTMMNAGLRFTAKGITIRKAGWRFITGEGLEEHHLPKYNKHSQIAYHGCGVNKCYTNPIPLHTEATLLSEMSAKCNKADIIEQLIVEGKAIRLNTQMIPTPKGMAAYAQILKEKYKIK